MDKSQTGSDSGRLAIINSDKCKPKKCNLQCYNKCPVNMQDKICVQVTKESTSCKIAESLCIGCGICVKVIFIL